MSSLNLFNTLEAYRQGKPIQIGEYISTAKVSESSTFLVSFVRMGGEAVPWGVAYQRLGKPAKFFSVADPRKRTDLSKCLAEFAKVFIQELHSEAFKTGSHPQVWVPNQTHLDVFHSLALRYLWTKFEDESESVETNQERIKWLRALGRLSNYLFATSQLPGQTQVVVASSAIRDAYCFPADSIRLSHLGFLMAWLTTPGPRERRESAADVAEANSISTSLDPEIERKELVDPVERATDRSSSELSRRVATEQIATVLNRELKHRLEILAKAYSYLFNDGRKPNPGLETLMQTTASVFKKEYLAVEEKVSNGENAWISSAETDTNPKMAASRYYERDDLQTQADAELLKHDDYLQSQAIATGSALTGKLSSVSREKSGRLNRIEWHLVTQDYFPLRIREGDTLYFSELVKSELVVERIVAVPERNERHFVLVVASPKTTKGGFDMADPKLLEREKIRLLPTRFTGGRFGKGKILWRKDMAGEWLLERLKEVGKQRRKAS